MENCNLVVLKLAEDFPVLVESETSTPWYSAGVGRAKKKVPSGSLGQVDFLARQ